MDARDIEKLLRSVRSGRMPVSRALDRLRQMPFEDLGFAKIDHHRGLRQGFAEVVYAPGKTLSHIVGIVRGMLKPRATYNILITRADERIYRAVRRLNRAARFHPLSRAITIRRNQTVVAQRSDSRDYGGNERYFGRRGSGGHRGRDGQSSENPI